MTTYSIGEVSKQTGLSIDTLRYYESIALVDGIARTQSGRRCYNDRDLRWFKMLICLRTTGMPIADMQQFAELVRAGDASKPERIELLAAHRQNVLDKIALMQRELEMVDYKINKYTREVAAR